MGTAHNSSSAGPDFGIDCRLTSFVVVTCSLIGTDFVQLPLGYTCSYDLEPPEMCMLSELPKTFSASLMCEQVVLALRFSLTLPTSVLCQELNTF